MQEKRHIIRIPRIKESSDLKNSSLNHKPVKNILIMALSTFKTPMESSKYYFEETGKKGTYYYQMEPVARVLCEELKKKNQTLDAVFLIGTPEVLDTRTELKRIVRVSKPDGTESKEEQEIQTEDGEGVTAFEYFSAFLRKVTYPDPVDIQAFRYKPEKGEQFPGEKTLCEIVSSIRSRVNPQTQIFIDTHGGFRTTQEILNSILSLLQLEHIHIPSKNIFTVEYDNTKKLGKVLRAGAVMQVLDFVSGMNELMNYARTDSLGRLSYRNQKEKRIIEDAGKIAEGIQLCNINGFEKGLDALRKDLKLYQDDAHPETLLNLFIGDIQKNYKDILKEDHDVMREIEWCMQKGFYQQALTLIESKIPEYLVSKKCIHMDGDVEEAGKNQEFEKYNLIFNRLTGFLVPKEKRMEVFAGKKSLLKRRRENEKGEEHWEYTGKNFYGSTIIVAGQATRRMLECHWGLKSLRNNAAHASNGLLSTISLNDLKQVIREYQNQIKFMVAYPKTNYINMTVKYKD